MDKHAQYTTAVIWTSLGPVRITHPAPKLTLWQRLIKWLDRIQYGNSYHYLIVALCFIALLALLPLMPASNALQMCAGCAGH